MDGTTLCPHCETRFRIVEAQLESHHGMVRCGNCLQAFDARPSFVPDQPHPQLELPMQGEATEQTEERPIDEPAAPEAPLPAAIAPEDETKIAADVQPEIPYPGTADLVQPEPIPADVPHEAQLAEPHSADAVVQHHKTLSEQLAEVQDEIGSAAQPKRLRWPWAIAVLLLLLILLAQAAYFFRVDLAARLPGLKPALTGFCQLLNCSVPLPQKSDLMSIESSELESNHAHENLITLNALLRNRAPYAQAYPNLELTLNDTQDKPLARRIFRPTDYLPPSENEKTGLLPNHELGIKLNLDTTSLKPSGYRLVLFYPDSKAAR